MRISLLAAALVWGGAAYSDAVVESARDIPVAADVDVVVAGGTAAGVSAAVAAADAGARVFLAGGFPYLGEDMAGTLELECDKGSGASELERRLCVDTWSFAPYEYDFERGFRYFGGWQFYNDRYDKLMSFNGVADKNKICELLESVAQKNYPQEDGKYELTMWSIVYSPHEGDLDFYFKENFDNPYYLKFVEEGDFVKTDVNQ